MSSAGGSRGTDPAANRRASLIARGRRARSARRGTGA